MPFIVDVEGTELRVTCADLGKPSQDLFVSDLMRVVRSKTGRQVSRIYVSGGRPVGRGTPIRALADDLRRRIDLVATCRQGAADDVHDINLAELTTANAPLLHRALAGERVRIHVSTLKDSGRAYLRGKIPKSALTKAVELALDAGMHIDELIWDKTAVCKIDEDFYVMLQRRSDVVRRARRPITITASVLVKGCSCFHRRSEWNGKFPPPTVAVFPLAIGKMAFMGCKNVRQLPPGARSVHRTAFMGTALGDEDDDLL